MRISSSAVIPFLFLLVSMASAPFASAQFKTEAFKNGYGSNDTTAPTDSAEAVFSLKEYFAGLKHEQELKIGTLAGGSAVFIGGQQIYHKQYWKLPIIYGGLGATVGGGFYYRDKSRTTSNLLFAGGALIYWGTMMDGVINFPTDNPHDPGKATLYSILLPGLGQAYNNEYWKIPVYWGVLAGTYFALDKNHTQYKRFKRIYNEATDPEAQYSGSISADTAKYYRDVYRRYRDWSIVATAAAYLLQVIDANVFAYMQDFEVNDDLTMNVSPAIITPDTQFALNGGTPAAFGLSMGFRF